jgi:hypothetical protein
MVVRLHSTSTRDRERFGEVSFTPEVFCKTGETLPHSSIWIHYARYLNQGKLIHRNFDLMEGCSFSRQTCLEVFQKKTLKIYVAENQFAFL